MMDALYLLSPSFLFFIPFIYFSHLFICVFIKWLRTASEVIINFILDTYSVAIARMTVGACEPPVGSSDTAMTCVLLGT